MIFITTVILILGSALVYNLVRYIRGDVPYSTTAEIQDFSLCDIKYSSPGNVESVTVCGHLITNGFAGLNIYVYRMPGEHVVGENPVNDKFLTGSFSRIIQLKSDETYARYKVVVYLYRDLIATIEFKAKR